MKSLRSSGRRDRGADGAQVGEAATEAALLGEHADRGRATALVGGGQLGRVGDVGQRALARAAALDLGDHAGAGRPEARHRVARARGGRGERRHLVVRRSRGARREVDAHAGDDLVEHGHATSRKACAGSGPASHPGGCGVDRLSLVAAGRTRGRRSRGRARTRTAGCGPPRTPGPGPAAATPSAWTGPSRPDDGRPTRPAARPTQSQASTGRATTRPGWTRRRRAGRRASGR